MSNPWPFIIIAVALTLIGALVSLLALLSPIRRFCQHSSAARITAICTLGLVSFVAGFGLLMRVKAEVTYIFHTVVIVDTFDPDIGAAVTWLPETEVNRPVVVRELWMRLLVPPAVRRSCYTDEAWVCSLADHVIPATSAEWGWRAYLEDVGIGCVSALATSVLAWFFTRGGYPSARAA